MNDTGAVDYDAKIPNNVQLSSDRALQRALEQWQPQFLDWWKDMGPNGFQDAEIYLRTAVSVDADGWAKFGYVKMPDYRWGILLAPREPDRVIPFGKFKGRPAWQEVPGEFRAMLRRLIVIQADTEPASVEQQRFLGRTAPSLYDMRNLFQVNVEEGRHLWAMVYLLHKYFGRDGREEADALLRRRSGDQDSPRILGAFNEATPDWLSFFMFTCFTDRDGKYQLEALAHSGFDPLSRTCRFMLTEEGHHMFVGRTGIERIIRRTCEVIREHRLDVNDIGAVRARGVIDLQTIQKKINFHVGVTEDLFGAEISTNSANAYNAGLKGRFRETAIDDDHELLHATYPVLKYRDGAFVTVDEPALTALNARLCDDYLNDCRQILSTWNRIIQAADIPFRLALPHRAFLRRIGEFADLHVSPQGEVLTTDEWEARRHEWLASPDDLQYLLSLMIEQTPEPGRFTNWIAPPKAGINGQPVAFEYVKIHQA
jgi:benzoyl-CoA 2,3-dioxygenase component B